MKKIASLLIVIVAIVGCGRTKQPAAAKEDEQQQANIFPVTSFIEGQMHLVDSFQLPTIKFITVNGRTDSSLISIDEFKQLAQEFTHPDINDPDLRKWYKETNFADQSINGVTLNYQATDKDLEIQRVDVVISASATMNDKVRSIFMQKQSVSNDTSIVKKLYWRTDQKFQIITSKQWGSEPEVTNIVKVEWNK